MISNLNPRLRILSVMSRSSGVNALHGGHCNRDMHIVTTRTCKRDVHIEAVTHGGCYANRLDMVAN